MFQETQQASRAAGCDDFLKKPVEQPQLFEKLRQHLHLEWIYGQTMLAPDEQQGEGVQSALIPPPRAELLALHDLAEIGDIMGLRERVAALDRSEITLKPFADHLRALAKAMKMADIRRFLQEYLEE